MTFHTRINEHIAERHVCMFVCVCVRKIRCAMRRARAFMVEKVIDIDRT